MNEDFVGDALHRAAELLPDAPDRLGAVRRKRASLVRRRLTAAAGLMVIAGGGSAFALGRSGETARVVTPADGPELTAVGKVVQPVGGGTRFCVPLPEPAILRIKPDPIVRCDLGVDVTGVDMKSLDNRREYEGGVEGWATLTGHLVGDTLVVTSQAKQYYPREDLTLDPRCAEPADGWEHTGKGGNPRLGPVLSYQSEHRDEVAQIAVARPTEDTAYPYLVTWGDPQPARTALAETYGNDRFCVVQSRWTREQVASAGAEFENHNRELGVYMFAGGLRLGSPHIGHDGQLVVEASAVRETTELDAVVARHPAGLIEITYWLHPVS